MSLCFAEIRKGNDSNRPKLAHSSFRVYGLDIRERSPGHVKASTVSESMKRDEFDIVLIR